MTRIPAAAFAALFAVLPVMAPAAAQAPAPTSAQPAPDDRAKQWLTLVDDSNYTEGARQMGTQAHKADIDKLPAIREPLGAMSSRNIKDVKLSRTNPGMPAGQYAVIRYDTSFARKANAVETVTLAMTKAGWAVVAYAVE